MRPAGKVFMRRILSILLLLTWLVMTFVSCGTTAGEAGHRRIVCTIFPLYDWARNVLGEEGGELSLLVKNGTDVHSFQPSARDITDILSADLFIYVGGESDEWVKEVLESAGGENVQVLCLMDVIGESAVTEELTEGMEGEAEEGAADEHIWLSLGNAMRCTDAIRDAVSRIDKEHEAVYRENAACYREKLIMLQESYRQAVREGERDTLLFPDRFPFRYLTEELGLDYYAAFSGCSAESEASFETVIFLASKADACNLDVLLVTESADGRLAQTVKDSMKKKDCEILVLDSLQSVTEDMVEEGYTYIGAMESNLAVIKSALA